MNKPVLIVVDDEPDMAELVADVADELGFSVLTATNVSSFQQLYSSEQPSAIVMDIVMPEMDGIELLEWMKSVGFSVPIIIMSGFDNYIDMAELYGRKQGGDIIGTLIKPFELVELEKLLQQILAKQG